MESLGLKMVAFRSIVKSPDIIQKWPSKLQKKKKKTETCVRYRSIYAEFYQNLYQALADWLDVSHTRSCDIIFWYTAILEKTEKANVYRTTEGTVGMQHSIHATNPLQSNTESGAYI